MFEENYEGEKTVKINRKTKLKTLKQVINLCLKDGRRFETYDKSITIESDEGNDVTFKFSDFGKNHTVKYAELDYHEDTGEVLSIVYHTKDNDFPPEFIKFFSKFPKLTKKQLAPVDLPPKPEKSITLPAGDGHKHYDINYLDNGKVVVGYLEFDLDQVANIYNFLGSVLGKEEQ